MRVLLFLLLSCFCASAADVITADRRVEWKKWSGVRGGIPNRSTIYTNLTSSASAATINSAIQNCPSNQVVMLGAGTYTLDYRIEMTKSGVTLRGSGWRNPQSGGGTLLLFRDIDATNDWGFLMGKADFSYDYSATTPVNITGGLTKDSTNLTVAMGHGLTVGTIGRIDEPEDNTEIDKDGTSGECTWCALPFNVSGGRPAGTVARIVATTATSITIEPPLPNDLTNGTPRFYPWNTWTDGFGLEDMSITNQITGSASAAANFFRYQGAANCWLKNTQVSGSELRTFWVNDSVWCEWRAGYYDSAAGPDFDSVAYASSHGYGIFIGQGTAWCLAEDNIFWRLHFGFAYEGHGAGNVAAYNFVTNIQYGADDYTVQPAIGFHGAHPWYSLWEGNVLWSKALVDLYWGTASHNTIFRNRMMIPNVLNAAGSPSQYCVLIDVWNKHWSFNVVGNVLGRVGFETVYDVTSGSIDQGGQRCCMRWRGNSAGDLSNTDSTMTSTLLKKWNWNSVDGGIHSGEDPGTDTSPDSYLYDSKPSWWGSVHNWPTIGPDIQSATNITVWNPAYERWLGIRNGTTNDYMGSGGGGGSGNPSLAGQGKPRPRTVARTTRL